MNKITLRDYALNHNKVLNRRHQPMSESYLYRLIREDIAGKCKRELWFEYLLEGPKQRIFILI